MDRQGRYELLDSWRSGIAFEGRAGGAGFCTDTSRFKSERFSTQSTDKGASCK
jgi:hypothetical protein